MLIPSIISVQGTNSTGVRTKHFLSKRSLTIYIVMYIIQNIFFTKERESTLYNREYINCSVPQEQETEEWSEAHTQYLDEKMVSSFDKDGCGSSEWCGRANRRL